MNEQAGFNCEFKVGDGTEVIMAKDCALTVNNRVIDVTARDSGGWEELISGIKAWSMTIAHLYKKSDVGNDQLRTAILAGTKLTNVKFLFEGGEGFKGDVLIESGTWNQPFEDAVAADLTLRGTGAVQWTSDGS